jgi:hypothetical protein
MVLIHFFLFLKRDKTGFNLFSLSGCKHLPATQLNPASPSGYKSGLPVIPSSLAHFRPDKGLLP